MSKINISEITIRETTNPYDWPNSVFGQQYGKGNVGELLLAIHALEVMNIGKEYNLELVYFTPVKDEEERKAIAKAHGFSSYIWDTPDVHLCIKRELSRYSKDIENSQNRVHDYLEGVRDAIKAIYGPDADQPPKEVVVIVRDSEGEFRVAGPNGSERSAYYTPYRDDAISTAYAMHGKDVLIRFKQSRRPHSARRPVHG
jgi:hypothetical protein